MTSEFKAADREMEQDAAEEPRDRTKLMWVGVVAVAAVMLGILWFSQRPTSVISQVRVKHILISVDDADPATRQRALAKAKELRERILKGENFEKLAREYSNDPWSSQRGGDLGYSQRGVFETAFEAYVWNPKTKVGEISELVKTSRGYHIIVVVDRRLSAADQYEQQIQQRMRQGSGSAAESGAE